MLNFRHVRGCIELNGASQVLKVKQMMKCFVWLALQSTVPQEPPRQLPAGGCSGCGREGRILQHTALGPPKAFRGLSFQLLILI